MKFLLEGTVPTGLEFTALEEVQEKFNVTGTSAQGRVFFEVENFQQLKEVGKFLNFYLFPVKYCLLYSSSDPVGT